MVFRQLLRNIPVALFLLGAIAASPGCILTPDEGGSTQDDTRITAERNTVEGTIDRHGQIWQLKRYPEYEEILHDEFEFYIRDDDAADFPWLIEDFWPRTVELEIARNMFDDGFSGEELPVDTIEYTYNVLNQSDIRDIQNNVIGVLVLTDAEARVLVGPDTGWFSDTRFEFDVVPDPDEPGLWQIKRQKEIRKT